MGGILVLHEVGAKNAKIDNTWLLSTSFSYETLDTEKSLMSLEKKVDSDTTILQINVGSMSIYHIKS